MSSCSLLTVLSVSFEDGTTQQYIWRWRRRHGSWSGWWSPGPACLCRCPGQTVRWLDRTKELICLGKHDERNIARDVFNGREMGGGHGGLCHHVNVLVHGHPNQLHLLTHSIIFHNPAEAVYSKSDRSLACKEIVILFCVFWMSLKETMRTFLTPGSSRDDSWHDVSASTTLMRFYTGNQISNSSINSPSLPCLLHII